STSLSDTVLPSEAPNAAAFDTPVRTMPTWIGPVWAPSDAPCWLPPVRALVIAVRPPDVPEPATPLPDTSGLPALSPEPVAWRLCPPPAASRPPPVRAAAARCAAGLTVLPHAVRAKSVAAANTATVVRVFTDPAPPNPAARGSPRAVPPVRRR